MDVCIDGGLLACPDNPLGLLLMAHGAGAPMDSPYMNQLSQALLAEHVAVLRFEFPYMQQRRQDGRRRPPPAAKHLVSFYKQTLERVSDWHASHPLLNQCPLWISGKSMGGRVATMLAAEHQTPGLAGVAAFGYPFHPPGKPEKPRISHLGQSSVPIHIFQGTRDPFGRPQEIDGYQLPPHIQLHWLESGNHDAEPTRKSGKTQLELLGYIAAILAERMRC